MPPRVPLALARSEDAVESVHAMTEACETVGKQRQGDDCNVRRMYRSFWPT